MNNLDAALSVTLIGMGIIFFVLILLLGTIIVLNKIFPYVAPNLPTPAPTPRTGDDAETVSVIHAALTKRLQRHPGKISVTPSP